MTSALAVTALRAMTSTHPLLAMQSEPSGLPWPLTRRSYGFLNRRPRPVTKRLTDSLLNLDDSVPLLAHFSLVIYQTEPPPQPPATGPPSTS